MRLLMSIFLTPIIIILGFLVYPASNPEVRIAIAVLAGTIVFNAIQSSVTAIFVAKTRNDISAALEVASKIISLVFLILVIHFNWGYWGYVLSMALLAIISALLAVIFARRLVSVKPRYDLAIWKPLFLMSIPLGLIQIINIIYFKIDSVLLSVMRTPAEVGYYGVSYRLIEVVMSIPAFFMLALMPAMVVADTSRLKILIQKSFDILLTMAIPVVIFSILYRQQIIVAISNPGFLPAALPFAILIVGAGASFINAVYGNALVATNRQNKLIPLTIFVVTFNLILNLILIPHFGIGGAALATTAAEIISMFYVYHLFRKASGIKTGLSQILKVAAGAAAGLLGYFLLGHFTSVARSTNLIVVALELGALTLVYGLVVMAVGGLPAENIKSLLKPGSET